MKIILSGGIQISTHEHNKPLQGSDMEKKWLIAKCLAIIGEKGVN